MKNSSPIDILPASLDPKAAAKQAHLRYVSDTKPGIRREKEADGSFSYFNVDGSKIDDEETLKRIRSLAIPPAYADVWICTYPNGHLQATGRDQKGRKQYRYHPQWRTVRDETKFTRMIEFGETLPAIRKRVESDMRRQGLSREKLLATLVRLLESTLIRVGNEEYARSNKSFGLTTMEVRHVDVDSSSLHFSFRGKSGKFHKIDLRDKKIASIVARCKDLPGREVFQYIDDSTGLPHSIHSEDVNSYIHEISGKEFTAKDFRTWAGTVCAACALCENEYCSEKKAIKQSIVAAVVRASEKLGNTPAVCRKAYIHPGVLTAYEEGVLMDMIQAVVHPTEDSGLSQEEAAVLGFLKALAMSGK